MLRPRHPARAALHLGALGVALASLSRPAFAQGAAVGLPNPRHVFEDSWYWGAKGGVTRFGTLVDGRVTAPVTGAEWLVTHRQGALLVSAEQSFFDRTSVVADPYATDGVRRVSLHDARRYSAAALAAPVQYGRVRPYAGLGLAVQVIRSATPIGDFTTQQQVVYVRDALDAGQSFVTPFIVAGAQAQFGAAAVFVQGNLSSARERSLLNRGGSSQIEAGLRYNLASAFER
ncbi:hypothetical protein J421_2607 [Gemmatirosa kalamazoonensis]|uniref:Uncharacterized protein n=1 Tax=Gemmatirosa kalamazoonensis TaxID=861299 RepID=W0RGB7_9BACT|nr:hypothetical protein [Gemmatirosa kalamazoonensis]AHG90144.1 hypothetical protein J421_2607 [Gemmatirosa kalamazoonensis]